MNFAKVFRIFPRLRNEYFKKFNLLKFRILGAKISSGANLVGPIYSVVMPGAKLTIGQNFTNYSGCGLNPLGRNIRSSIFLAKGAEVKIGDNTGISCSSIRCKESITIGNNVKIGADCLIIDTDAHSLDYRHRNGTITAPDGSGIDSANALSAPIVIEDDVLIGTRCIVLKGVTIGARSIIGAGSVVVKSIPSDCIAAGNPAKIIKTNINHE